MSFIIFILFYIVCASFVHSEENVVTNETDMTTLSTTTEKISSTSSIPDNRTCEQNNGDCKKCVRNRECFYCELNSECHAIAMDSLFLDKNCPLNKRNIGQCKINLMIVYILVGVAAGIVVIGIICCCCCCCKRDGKIKLSKDDLKWARQREERKKRAEEQRQQRAAKTDEIRRKYGLFKNDTPYQRFDA